MKRRSVGRLRWWWLVCCSGAWLSVAVAPARATDAQALYAQAKAQLASDRLAAIGLLEQASDAVGASQDWPLRQQIFTSLCWARAPYEPALAAQYSQRQRATLNANTEAVTSAELLLCEAYAAEQQGESEQAGARYADVVEAARALADDELLESALSLHGQWLHGRGEYADALLALQQSFAINQRLGRDSRRRFVLNAIANLYADQRVGDYDKALEYLQQLHSEHQRNDDRQNLGTAEFNIASTLELKGDLQAALPHYHAALALARELGHAEDVALTERAIGGLLVKLGRAEEAMPLLDAALAFFQRNRNAENLAMLQLSRGLALHALAQPEQALQALTEADRYFTAVDNPRFLERIRQAQAAIYQAQGKHAAAVEALQQQLQLRERLAEQLNANLISRLRVQFDTARKEQQNQQLQRENALHEQALAAGQRIRMQQSVIIALTALVAIVLAYLFFRQRSQAERMRVMALTDELTRLPNRRHVFQVLTEQLQEAHQQGRDYCVLMLDIDHFKQINDRHGHDVGDKVLQRVAHCLRTTLRPGDVVGRVGGEEFLVLLPATAIGDAAEVAERMRTAVSQLSLNQVAAGLQASISMGLAARLPDERTGSALLKRADEALYQAKQGGRNRVVVAPAPT
ncbi:MAG: diguanylate cyclase [Permianibacter sp.]